MTHHKYRAWDTVDKDFFTGIILSSHDIIVPTAWMNNDHDVVWEQWTGLKDRHDVEIYINDIVDCIERINDGVYEKRRFIVHEDPHGLGFELKSWYYDENGDSHHLGDELSSASVLRINNFFTHGELRATDHTQSNWNAEQCQFEIIGDIHSTPELLTSKTKDGK